MSCRRYIPAETGVADFLKGLQRRGIAFAVLRWFEALPHVEPGEDIDLLVADEDAGPLLALVEETGSGQPLDIYSVTGRHGLGFRRAPYLPPARARLLLERRVHGTACDRPCAEDHWAALAFHVVWHKASLESADHDYRAALGLKPGEGLKELAARLDAMGWRPGLKQIWRWRRQLPIISARSEAGAKAASGLPHIAAKASD